MKKFFDQTIKIENNEPNTPYMSALTIEDFCEKRDFGKIQVPGYQSGLVKTRSWNIDLILTILNPTQNYLPPLIFNKYDQKLEVVDGKQRGDAIYLFMNNDFAIPTKVNINGDIIEKNYSQLSLNAQEVFSNYKLNVATYVNASSEDMISISEKINKGSTPIREMMSSLGGFFKRSL